MSVRSGMVNLIAEIRSLTDTKENEVEVNGVSYWTDVQLQDVLDRHSYDINDLQLIPRPLYYSGSYEYRKYYLPKGVGRHLEDGDSIQVVDVYGNVVSSSLYTVDLNKGLTEFTADTLNADYYLRATGFQFYVAVSDVWQQKASHRYQLISYKAGQQSLDEDKEYRHCLEMAKYYKSRYGIRSSRLSKWGEYNG